MNSYLYALMPQTLELQYASIVEACRRQSIGDVSIMAAVTGKLTAAPEALGRWRARLVADGFQVSAMVFAVGHPAMDAYYNADGSLKKNPWYEGGLVGSGSGEMLAPLPRGWQYAVNEFGQNVYCSACPNAAWREGNVRVVRELAGVFDVIWYDDEYRMDSDQWGGESLASTACCYCDRCMAELGRELGREISRSHVLGEQKVHEAWVARKVRMLADGWQAIAAAGRSVNAKLALGLMVRWGGEERDGLDLAKLLPVMVPEPLLRAGEGHFGAAEYAQPVSQVVEHLVTSYHVSWFPQPAVVRSETTYFTGMSPRQIMKKAVLALAAGAGQLAYCPCVNQGVLYQQFIEAQQTRLSQWATALADKRNLAGIQIVRTPAAAMGDKDPGQRRLDRQPFPLLSLAGLCSHVVRAGSWREDSQAMVAVTGRSVWDWPWRVDGRLVLDGAALLEMAPVNRALGISQAKQAAGGAVRFVGDGWEADGRLWCRGEQIIIPVVWQEIPPADMEAWLGEIRRVLSPLVDTYSVEGDLGVLPVQHHTPEGDVVLLVNLTDQPRRVRLGRPALARRDGGVLTLEPEEIRIIKLATATA